MFKNWFTEILAQLTSLRAVQQETLHRLDDLRAANAKAQGELSEVRIRAAVAQNNFEWARERMNHLEHERGILFMRLLNTDLPVAEVQRTQPLVQTGANQPIKSIDDLQMGITFEDVGDDEAVRLGITHDDDGNVRYRR